MYTETSNTFQSDTISEIQKLIKLNIDSAKGFELHAEQIGNPTLKKAFADTAYVRGTYAKELQSLVALTGDRPEQSGSASGTLHRLWEGITSPTSNGEDHHILAQAEHAEDVIRRGYEEAMAKLHDPAVSELVASHYRTIKESHDQIREMRDFTAPA